MDSSFLPASMGKIVGQTSLSSLGRAIVLGQGKRLNSKPEECYSRESMAHWYIILLLSAYSKRLTGST